MVVHNSVSHFLFILSVWVVMVGLGVPLNVEPSVVSAATVVAPKTAKTTWYSLPKRFTASGKKMNPNLMHTAHKTLPFGTIVEMAADTGNIIYVEVTDRGPYDPNDPAKQFDLTPAAFKALGHNLKKGVATVRWRVIHNPKVHSIQPVLAEV